MKTEATTFQRRFVSLYKREAARREAEGERMTRQDYANRVGTTVNSLRGWLAGTGQPDADGLARIATVEKVSVDWLVGKTSEMREESDDPQKARLIQSIKTADYETLSKLEQFYGYLEFQKKNAGMSASDKKEASK